MEHLYYLYYPIIMCIQTFLIYSEEDIFDLTPPILSVSHILLIVHNSINSIYVNMSTVTIVGVGKERRPKTLRYEIA